MNKITWLKKKIGMCIIVTLLPW
jgi:hypothetical protein